MVFKNFIGSLFDRAILKTFDPDNKRRGIIAAQNVRCESLRLYLTLVFLVIGVLAILTPPAPPTDAETNFLRALTNTVFLVGLIGANIFLVVTSVMDAIERPRLLEPPQKEG